MKKLSFVLALVFAGYFVMAQHVQTTTQTGNGNQANITQSFGPNPGPSLDGNVAHVTQTGDLNKADVMQVNNGYGGQAMNADIISTGDQNQAKITQNLEGEGDAIITQIGNQNKATIFESGNFAAGSPLEGSYDAYAFQQGNENVIEMTIWGTDATGFAWQLGSFNSITQNIGTGVGNKDQNSNVLAKQQGNSNVAIQSISGNGFAGGITTQYNTAWIAQFGNSNYAKQTMAQNDGDLSSPTNDYEYVEQYGNSNSSIQQQWGQVNLSSVLQGKHVVSNNNMSTTSQTGNFNTVYVSQN